MILSGSEPGDPFAYFQKRIVRLRAKLERCRNALKRIAAIGGTHEDGPRADLLAAAKEARKALERTEDK